MNKSIDSICIIYEDYLYDMDSQIIPVTGDTIRFYDRYDVSVKGTIVKSIMDFTEGKLFIYVE